MKNKTGSLTVVIIATLISSAFSFIHSLDWKIKEGYQIKFSSETQTGVLNSLSGKIQFDENNLPVSKFDMVVDAASINTGNGMKNTHAKGADFLDVAQYPNITFTSTSISKTEMGYSATGKLKIRGIEKEITIPFTFTNNTFAGSFTVNRLDYGVGSTEGMTGKASKELKIDISVPVTK